MQHHKQLDRIVGYSAIAVVTMIIGMATLWPFEHARYCGADETTGQCAREWLGVIIGAATVFGGVIAAWVVFKTIGPLQEQLAEMRRQTSFMLGNESPVVEFRPITTGRAQLRLVNWNARAFTWRQVRFWPNFEAGGAVIVTLGEHSHQIDTDGIIHPCIVLEGWENRSGRPPVVSLELAIGSDAQVQLTAAMRDTPVTVVVVGELSGEARGQRRLSASETMDSLFHIPHVAPPSAARA